MVPLIMKIKLSVFTLTSIGILITVLGCASAPQNNEPRMDSAEGTSMALPTENSGLHVKKHVADVDPYQIAEVNASTTSFGGLGMKDCVITVQFAPRDNTVILLFSSQNNKMTVYLTPQNRILMINGMKQYLDAFEQRTLEKGRGSEKTYGRTETTIEWSLFSVFTQVSQAFPKMQLGYEFFDRTPYFSLTFPDTDNVNYSAAGPNRIKKSVYMQLFFTRTQLESFGELMLQEYLENTLKEQNIVTPETNDRDVY